MFIVYKTTNLVNNKFYVGVHKQENPNIFDGYLGSNKILHRAIKKYGIESFKREVLIECETREEAFDIESLLICEKMCKRPDVYNISPGGVGNCNLGTNSVSKKLGMHSDDMSKEDKSNLLKMGHSKRDPEERRETCRKNRMRGTEKVMELKLGFLSLPPEIRVENARKGGLIGGKVAFENKSGFHAIPHDQKMENSRRGGITAGNLTKENGTGMFSLTKEERLIAAKKGAKVSAEKNKGSKWYNDGKQNFKYYKEQDLEVPYDEFIKINNFNKGFIIKEK